MDETDGALRYSIVLVVQCCQDARQVAQRRNLVSQLALCAEQTHGCCGNGLQRLTLKKTRDVNNMWKNKLSYMCLSYSLW